MSVGDSARMLAAACATVHPCVDRRCIAALPLRAGPGEDG